MKQPNIKKSKEFAEWVKKLPYDEVATEDIYDPEIGEIIIYKGDSKNKILKNKKKSAAYESLRAIEDGTYLEFYKKFRPHAFKEGRINLKDLIREERSQTFDLFLKKDLIQMPRNYSAKIIGGSSALNKLEDALVKWDAQYRKSNSYKDGDIEKFARKFVGDAGINKAKKWFADDDENLKEGRMNIRGVKNVEKSLGQGSADSTYFAMNKLGYQGYPNSSDDPRVVDFMITKRMYDGTIKIIMKDTMAKDPRVQAEIQRLKK